MKKTDITNTSKKNLRTNRWKKGLLISGISTLVLTLFLGGYLIYLFNQFGNKVYHDIPEEGTEQAEPDPFGISDIFTNSFKEPLTILVLGVDARENESFETARTDTIMVMTINPDTKQVATVSFPRDSYVMLPERERTKINHAMYYGGIPLLKETIEYNFDIKIDNYLAIDFVAFKDVVDKLGGLEVYTPSSMYYVASDIHVELTPGYHYLNGEELLGYVRYRHDEAGDLGRIKRQQYVIRALSEKATNLKTIIKAPQLIDILGDHIYTDLNKQDLLSIIKTYRNFAKEDWHPLTLGGKAARSEKDNLWYYFYDNKDKEQVTSFIQAYINGKS